MSPQPRDLDLNDIPRIVCLEADLFGPEAWSTGICREELTNPFRAYRGIEEDGTLVAYGGVITAEPAEILTLGVARTHQRRGLGSALLHDLLAIAARHAREVFLEVRVSDDVARRLYERHGFRAVGVRPNYYQHIGEDALVMRAALPRP